MNVERVRVQFGLRVDDDSDNASVRAETRLYRHLQLLRSGRRTDLGEWVLKACLHYFEQERDALPGSSLFRNRSAIEGSASPTSSAAEVEAPIHSVAAQNQNDVGEALAAAMAASTSVSATEEKCFNEQSNDARDMWMPPPASDSPLKQRMRGMMG